MHIGIIGSGQLAQMLAHAGQKMDMMFSFLGENIEQAKPVEGLGNVIIYSGQESAEAVYFALGKPDVITVEKESVDPRLLKELNQFCRIAPNPDAVAITQNRAKEKAFLRGIKIPTVNFVVAASANEIENAIKELGFPVVIKSVEEGYDGKNQWRIFSSQDLSAFLKNYQQDRVVVEQWVEFSAEVSMIAARSAKGEKVFYPLTENRHKNGVLLTSKVPSKIWAEKFESQAIRYISKIMDETDYIGVMAMECFIVNTQLVVNELAPRVHNSGHWSISGSNTSQFENHLRAIAGLPLGDASLTGSTAMLNLLGKSISASDIRIPNATLHWYNKECKPGRKMGHINIQSHESAALDMALSELEKQIYSN